MNILWLNAGLLLPLDKGGKLRTWHLMRHLARRHAITYVSFAAPDQPPGDIEGMREVAERTFTVPRAEVPKRSVQFYADASGYLLNSVPYAVAKYRSNAYAARVNELLRREHFDLLVCDFLPPLVNMPPRPPMATVLFTHNVEAEIWRRHAETATNPVTRALLRAQWRRMLAFEGTALDRFDLVLAVSEADRDTFDRLYPSPARKYHVVPTGVDTAYFAPEPPHVAPGTSHVAPGTSHVAPGTSHVAPGTSHVAPGTLHVAPLHVARDVNHLVFTGSMDWLPNEDGMLFFCREILPRIRQAEPGVTLSIVGRAPTPAVRRLAETAGIQVTGRVDDVRPYVARADVYVVPLRIGGGTRLKIFEAMAMGKAVVSTTIGAEGLPVTNGRDIVLADEPGVFADAVVRLLRERGRRERLAAAARQLVLDKYDWSAVAGELEAALITAADRERTAVA